MFRSDYGSTKQDRINPLSPSSELYTIIGLKVAYALFWIFYISYGLLLTLLKQFISKDFKAASHGKRIQHIIELLNMPEAYSDWDTDSSLDVAGHIAKWKKVLVEMIIMVLMQTITNIVLLLPFLVTGNLYFSFHTSLLQGSFFHKVLFKPHCESSL